MLGTKMLRDFLFLILFSILLGVWGFGWLAFHVAGGLIHLLLILAVVSLILHLFRGPRHA
jgi:Family of unknown function (DUF5670)